MSIRYYNPALLFEVTARTIGGAFLFDPVIHHGFAAAFNAIIAIAQKKHGIRIYAYFAMSNHYHGIFGADNPDSFADFLCDVHGNMARYANRVQGRIGPVFNGRCDVTPIIAGDKCLSDRIAYIMGQAIKVDRHWTLDNWPGANTNRALLYGEPVVGKHFARHRKTLDARRKDGPKADEAYTSEQVVAVSPPPGWEALPEPELRARYRSIGQEAVRRFGQAACPEGGNVQVAANPDQSSGLEAEFRGEAPSQTGAAAAAAAGAGDSPTGLTEAQRAWMQMPRPRPPKKEHKRQRRPSAYADTPAKIARYRDGYKAIRQAHLNARRELEKQTERALRGKRARAVQFPLWTFAAVAPLGRLARDAGKVAALGDLV